jgi:hypothetical protein
MPFLSTTPKAAPARFHKLLEVQDLEAYAQAGARRERSFKLKFGACLVAAVFCGSFLWTLMVF